MGKVEVLISAMHQNDLSIIAETNIKSDVLLINQCDRDDVAKIQGEHGAIRCISTKERGLSRSRNMALENAIGEFCLVCDDDELLLDDYAEKIEGAFKNNPDADVIRFIIEYENKKYPLKPKKMGYMDALKTSSVQIAFRKSRIIEKGIRFDTNFGSGTKVNFGEENIFLFDCLRAGLKMYFEPIKLGRLREGTSQWFSGYNEKYFEKRGFVSYRLFGKLFGYIYCLYFAICKYSLYKKETSFWRALSLMMKNVKEIS